MPAGLGVEEYQLRAVADLTACVSVLFGIDIVFVFPLDADVFNIFFYLCYVLCVIVGLIDDDSSGAAVAAPVFVLHLVFLTR